MGKFNNVKTKTKSIVTHLTASCPVEYKDAKGELQTSWKRCGVAFKGEKGINVILDTLPINGKLFLSEYVAPEAQAE
jgi:hypothetical protein